MTKYVEVLRTWKQGRLEAYLYGFDVDGYKLKAEHTTFLSQTIGDITIQSANNSAKGSNGHCSVWLLGTASRTAPHTYNQGLSERRASAVKQYFKDNMSPSVPCVVTDKGLSETFPLLKGKYDSVEDPLDRSVLVVAEWYSHHTPKPPAIIRPTPKAICGVVKKSFKIRAVWAISDSKSVPIRKGVEGGVKWADLDLEVLDVNRNEVATYDFTGVGPTGKFLKTKGGKSLPGSTGRWHPFVSTAICDKRADGFGGSAILETASVAGFGGTSFYFSPDPKFPARFFHEISDFDTGIPKDSIAFAELTTIFGEMKLRGSLKRLINR